MPAAIAGELDAHRRAARAARAAGDDTEAWRLLERTHILSQPWPSPHVRCHIDMLRLAVGTRDRREALGQLARIIVVCPGATPAGTRSATPAAPTSPPPS